MSIKTNSDNAVLKKYEAYNTKIKPNKTLMLGINMLLAKEGILQYAILQFIANNTQGTTIDLLVHVGIDMDLCKIILEELLKNEFIEEKDDLLYITDTGKSLVIASYFKSLESL